MSPRLTTLKPSIATIDTRRGAPVAVERIRGGKEKRWYDSQRWRKSREWFLSRHPLCVMCAKSRGADVIATVVDHVEPHKGDYDLFWDQGNWQSLCATCHSGNKRQQENHGYSKACDVNGVPMDSSHPFNQRSAS